MSNEFIGPNWPCYKEKGTKLVDCGCDSQVYQITGLVIKRYFPETLGYDENKLIDYFHTMNDACDYVKKHPITIYLPNLRRDLSMVVNPCFDMHKCGICGEIEGVSKYIFGKNLQNSNETLEIPDSDYWYMRTEFHRLNTILNDELKITGINIVPVNVKVLDNEFIITDLCSQIKNFYRR